MQKPEQRTKLFDAARYEKLVRRDLKTEQTQATGRKPMSIKQLIADVLKKEGGYVNHPADRGGPTNMGITKAAFADYRGCKPEIISTDTIKRLSVDVAEKIYMTLYYVRPKINQLPMVLQPVVFDMAVNHGPGRAIKILQETLNRSGYNVGKIDGIIGSLTVNACVRALVDLGHSFINNLVESRLDFYREIVAKDATQAVFINGWETRAKSFTVEGLA